MCEVMKTKSTYWSVIRSLVATIVAVMGFAMVSVGQDVENLNNVAIADSYPCGTGIEYKLSVEANKYYQPPFSFSVKKDGEYVSFSTVSNFKETKNTQYAWSPDKYRQEIVLPEVSTDAEQNTTYYFYVKINVANSKIECFNSGPNCGPTISNITSDGTTTLSSVCLNNDDVRNSIRIPETIMGAATGDGHQGWTIDGEKNTTLTLDYIKDPANMSELDGKTLQYWAEDDNGTLGYSNGVMLSVCMPEVGSIKRTGAYSKKDYICLNKSADFDVLKTGPATITYPAGYSEENFNKGWEIVETGARLANVEGINKAAYYGKTLRYYVEDKNYPTNIVYSNEVKLMSKPTVTMASIEDYKVCPNERIMNFPDVTYNANGTTIKSANWVIKPKTSSMVDYKGEVADVTKYDYIAFKVKPTEACGETSVDDAKVQLSTHLYTKASVDFVSLPSIISCNTPYSSTVEVVDAGGSDISLTELNMFWTKEGKIVGQNTSNQYNFSFDCEEESGTIELGAIFLDPSNGCRSTVSQSVRVTNDFVTYYYNGGTGASSNVTNKSNWCLMGSSPCTSPDNFTNDNCRYIIAKENVVLNSDWSVSGVNSKVIVGDGETTSSFVVNGNLTCEEGINVSKNATLDIKSSTIPVLGRINQENSTVIYSGTGSQEIQIAKYNNLTIQNGGRAITFPDGTINITGVFSPVSPETATYNMGTENKIVFSAMGNQTIPAFTFNILDVENAYVKTLGGNVTVNKYIITGTSTTLAASNYILEMKGDGDVFYIGEGKFDAGTSTVKYTSPNSSNVAALNYHNLSLGTGPRVYASKGTIGISGEGTCFVPSTGETIVEGSTIEFNSTSGSQQIIPGTTYNNLRLNSSQHFYVDGVDKGNVVVVVNGNIDFVKGVVTVTTNTGGSKNCFPRIDVRNTSSNAITFSSESFSKICVQQHINANSTSSSESYSIPVANAIGDYTPISVSNITTGDGDAWIMARKTSPEDQWNVWYSENFVSGSYSVVTKNNLSGRNSIVGDGNNLKGTVSGDKSIINSEVGKYSTITVGTRVVSSVVYRYNCSSDVTNPSNWTLTSGSGDNPPTSFDIDDAVWEITCTTTIPAGESLSILGNNSKLRIVEKAGFLKVYGALSVAGDLTLHEDGRLGVFPDADVSVYGSYSHTGSKEATIINRGNITFYTSVNLQDVNLKNEATGVFNVIGGDFSIKQANCTKRNTHITNQGVMNCVNSNVTMYGGDDVACRPLFVNDDGAVFTVDNRNAPGKNMNLVNRVILGENEMDFKEGSSLAILGCNLNCAIYNSTNSFNGDLTIVDGNLKAGPREGGGVYLTFGPSSTVVLYDTDNSGDGVFDMNGDGGGCSVVSQGVMYVEGLIYKSNGGGNTFDVEDGSTVFIGNLGASLQGNKWQTTINVEGGSTTYYCGNITPGKDDVGSVDPGGTLYYAQEYYEENPVKELDFTDGGNTFIEAIYQSKAECVAAAKDFAKQNSGIVYGITLPVELTMLYGICKNGNVELHWQTASESNNEGFVILRSFDGVNFEEIAEVMGAGTSTGTINYMYVDEEDKTGMVYYKLRQVDFDGKTKESKIVAVQTCGPNAQFAIAEDEITVSFKNPEETNYVVVTSLSGKIVFSKSFKDVAEARIASPRIKGVYIISVIDSKQITSEKFIK